VQFWTLAKRVLAPALLLGAILPSLADEAGITGNVV
jgi:hypothetical protein